MDFRADVPMHLLQSLRLCHALAETEHLLHVKPGDRKKFARLAGHFSIDYKVGVDGVPLIPDLLVDHATPATSVGRLSRALIFPHGIVKECRRLWPEERPIRVGFAGLLTEVRARVLHEWASRNDVNLRRLSSRSGRIGRRLTRRLDEDPSLVPLWPNKRGRRFPLKAWDPAYYRFTASCRFVLCPKGDFSWTYRFFEAVLCGAIPVVEEACDQYRGLEYRMMDEPAEHLRWSSDVASRNFEEAAERLTVDRGVLGKEIERLVGS